jgi:CRP/FNR family transcriptional regulator
MIHYTLSRSMFGSGLKAPELHSLVEVCRLCPVEKHAYLFRQEDEASHFYLVHSGAIQVHRLLPDGREQVIHVFRPTESFAEVALAGQQRYPVSAVALEPSQVIAVNCAALRCLIHRMPDLSVAMIASMSMHLKFLVGRLEQQKFQSAPERLAHWLMEHPQGGDSALIPVSQKKKNLAAQLGMSSETLSRTLRRFKDAGWLSENNGQWSIGDRDALQRILKSAASGEEWLA